MHLQGSVGTAIFRAFGRLWIYAGFLHLLSCSFLFAAPLLLREFLKNIPSEDPHSRAIVLSWALIMSLCSLSATLLRMQYEFMVHTVKLYVSRSLQQLLYMKTLAISVKAKAEFGLGNVTNLWINDTAMILQCVRQGHYVWGTPFQVRNSAMHAGHACLCMSSMPLIMLAHEKGLEKLKKMQTFMIIKKQKTLAWGVPLS